MDGEKPMKIVLVEDDVSACKKFMECAAGRTDIVFVGMTGRSDEGLRLVRDRLPDAVILDMELNWGEGSGFDFLDKFMKMDLSIRPIVVITTRNRSEAIQEQLHDEYGVDWIFCKLQSGYSQEMVVNHLLKMRPYLTRSRGASRELKTIETPEELRDRIMQRINAELNAFGVSVRLKGRELAAEAIYLLLTKDSRDSDTVFQDLAAKHKTHYNNVVRNIQTAINDAWINHDDIEALLRVYTAPVRKDAGSPSPTEFIHFYADKIRRDM